ncbi:hypothetical protein HPB49_025937 [Dermacentor silvarum]|nr:hypothetical protein HPB49_025937 [Dermacentor silvarum]
MSKRSSLADEITGEWTNKSDPGWIRLALFGLFGSLPVICLLHSPGDIPAVQCHSFPSIHQPKEETRGSLHVEEVSSPIRRSTFVQSSQTRHHRPKPSALSQQHSTTAALPPPDDGVKDPVCTAIDCHFGAQWLRSKLDSSVDPCQDFYRYVCGTFTQYNEFADAARTILTTTVSHAYDTKVPATGQTSWQKVAGLFQTCISMSETRRSETEDLVAWMLSLNLDLNNETKLRSVDTVDMIIRCSLDLGVQVIFSITFHATWFLNNRRVMQLECCPEEVKWMDSQGYMARHRNSGDYVRLLRLYGVSSPRDEQLATRIMKYEESLHGIIKNTTPPVAPVVSGTIRGMGQTTKPYVTPGL